MLSALKYVLSGRIVGTLSCTLLKQAERMVLCECGSVSTMKHHILNRERNINHQIILSSQEELFNLVTFFTLSVPNFRINSSQIVEINLIDGVVCYIYTILYATH